jgi:hypothetical protein
MRLKKPEKGFEDHCNKRRQLFSSKKKKLRERRRRTHVLMRFVHSACVRHLRYMPLPESEPYLPRLILRKLNRDDDQRTLTPSPFVNNAKRFKTSPRVPGMKVVTRPQVNKDTGIKNPAPNRAARRRSSGTHSPNRRFFHLMIMLSEIRPDTGAPTIYQRAGQRNNKCKELGGSYLDYQLLLAPTTLQ